MNNYFEDSRPLPITKKGCIIVALTAISAGAALQDNHLPEPTLMIFSADLPQVIENVKPLKINSGDTAASLYHNMREEFAVSHSIMATWLGLKRRSLYNWLKHPDSCTKQSEIEDRLFNLSKLIDDMEPEHVKLTYKIAFSPIYGDKKFGKDILDGANHDVLIGWYDRLFDRFEAYRSSLT